MALRYDIIVAARRKMNPTAETTKPQLVREEYGGEMYEYYPLGEYVVVAPGVCGGRPTFKYTRLEVSVILSLVARGTSISEILWRYDESHINADAITEAVELADRALIDSTRFLQPALA